MIQLSAQGIAYLFIRLFKLYLPACSPMSDNQRPSFVIKVWCIGYFAKSCTTDHE
jgi:hypothetical protein